VPANSSSPSFFLFQTYANAMDDNREVKKEVAKDLGGGKK